MKNSCVVFIAILCLGGTNVSAEIFLPPGVAPGSQYQLAFITSQSNVAPSGEISYYNDFVNNSADLAGIGPHSPGGVLWHAIGSTAAIDAIDNAPVTAPLYTMHGDLIATSAADLWDGTIAHAIDYSESGAYLPGGGGSFGAWTATLSNGRKDYRFFFGDSWVIFGTNATDFTWVQNYIDTAGDRDRALYAISDPITAPDTNPAAVPEPSAIVLVGGLLSTLGPILAWRRRQRKAA